MYSISIRVWLM